MKLWKASISIYMVTALSGCAHQYLAVNTELVASLASQPKPLDVTNVRNTSAPPLSTSNRISGDGWTWQVGTSGVAMGGDFASANSETICIEFQNGLLAADGARALRPWPSIGLIALGKGLNRSVGQPLGKGPLVGLFEVCVPPGGKVWSAVYWDPKAVSNSDQLFGARDGPDMANSVKGRTMQLEIPLRIGERRERLRLEFTATAAYMVTAYW